MKYSIHYGGLKFVDMLDGPGLRVTLLVDVATVVRIAKTKKHGILIMVSNLQKIR